MRIRTWGTFKQRRLLVSSIIRCLLWLRRGLAANASEEGPDVARPEAPRLLAEIEERDPAAQHLPRRELQPGAHLGRREHDVVGQFGEPQPIGDRRLPGELHDGSQTLPWHSCTLPDNPVMTTLS